MTFLLMCNFQVCDHFAGDFQPELRTLQEQPRRPGELSICFHFLSPFDRISLTQFHGVFCQVTYTINDFSHINSNHLCYFKFVGRVIAKAIYDNKLLECYFTRFYFII